MADQFRDILYLHYFEVSRGDDYVNLKRSKLNRGAVNWAASIFGEE
ncbi:hypothetical protein OAK32_02320 [Mariniblastus sp.]|nr:hypothetical protein [Mariniblastus sp.]